MNDVFLEDFPYATEVDLEIFRRRPWHERVAAWAVEQITRLR